MAQSRWGTVLHYLRKVTAPGAVAELSDDQLLGRFINGRDEAAFTEMVERHGPLVLGVCQRVLHHDQDAEDAFQATFLVLERRAAQIVKRESLGSWLYGVALRIAGKAKAVKTRRRLHERRVPAIAATNPVSDMIWRDLAPVLDEEIGRLPRVHRAAFVLCCLEGKTVTAAARQLGWPRGTVATQLARARQRLRTQLTRRGLALSAGLVVTLSAHKAAAALPPNLIDATVKGALLFAAGKSVATGALSASVTAMAEGALQTMLVTKLTIATVILFVAAVVGGSGAVAYHSIKSTDDGPNTVATQNPLSEKDKPDQKSDKQRIEELQKEAQSNRDLARQLENELKEMRERLKITEELLGRAQAELQLLKNRRREGIKPAPERTPLATFHGHNRAVHAIAFAPDGRRLASTSEDGTAKVWDVATGKEVISLSGRPGWFMALVYSPDGKMLITAGNMTITFWDARTGQELRVINLDPAPVAALAISPDGRLLVSGSRAGTVRQDGTVRMWDVATGKEARRFADNFQVGGIVFTRDGRRLAASVGNSVRVWDVASGKELIRFGQRSIQALAISPDGKVAASAGSDNTLCLWDPATGKQLASPSRDAIAAFHPWFLPRTARR
jgi:RNA polymerase sigma factor (sigma-70 family)